MGRIFPEQKLNYATAAPVTFIQTENKNKKSRKHTDHVWQKSNKNY